MQSFYWSVSNTENITPRVSKTSDGKTMLLSKFTICGCKKSRLVKNQEVNGLLSSLGFKLPLGEILLLGDILFYIQFHWVILNDLIVIMTIVPY